MTILKSLSLEQKEAVSILQIGTFLEYFDLMIFVHLGVVINEVFFPKSDPYTAQLILAVGYCATFVARPIGALIFGYIGDTIGRKPTIIITTMLMAASCIVMATLPSYSKIGITASLVVLVCRMLQGMSSMGEIIGAEIYLTEFIKSKSRYAVVSLLECAAVFGGVVALLLSTAILAIKMDWRVIFWIGGLVALIGTAARTALRETPDFLIARNNSNSKLSESLHKVSKKNVIAYFGIQCGYPLFFYFTYIYCSDILKQQFTYTSAQIIQHNLIVTVMEFIIITFLTYLSCKIYPLRIVRFRMTMFIMFSIFIPYLLMNINSPVQLLLIQAFLCCFTLSVVPGSLIFFTHFPVLKRFTCSGLIFSFSRALMSIVTSFGLVYLTKKFSYLGLFIIFIPICIIFILSLSHFEKLERSIGNYN